MLRFYAAAVQQLCLSSSKIHCHINRPLYQMDNQRGFHTSKPHPLSSTLRSNPFLAHSGDTELIHKYGSKNYLKQGLSLDITLHISMILKAYKGLIRTILKASKGLSDLCLLLVFPGVP